MGVRSTAIVSALIAGMLLLPQMTFAGADLAQQDFLSEIDSSQLDVERDVYAARKKRKCNAKCKERKQRKKGKKVFKKTCALGGCHAGSGSLNDLAARFAGYTVEDIVSLGYAARPEMSSLVPPSRKKLAKLAAYFASLE